MDREEFKLLVATTVVLGFCFSFREWGVTNFDFGFGFKNFILITILVGISIVVHELTHNHLATKYGTEVKFRTWKALLFAAVLITIITNGYVIFAAVWAVSIGGRVLRPRHKYPHVGPWESAKIAASGPMANFFFALLSAAIAFKTGSYIWHKLMVINVWIAGMNLFPFFRIIPILLMGGGSDWRNFTHQMGKAVWSKSQVPYMEGEVIFFGSPMFNMFLLLLVTITAVLVVSLKMIFTGLFIGLLIGIIYWIYMEKNKGELIPIPKNMRAWKWDMWK